MAASEPDTAVRLRNTQAWDKQFLLLAGFTSLVFVPITVDSIIRRDWGGVLLLAIPAGVAAVGKWVRRVTPEDYLVLHPDRMEISGCGAGRTVVSWSEVKGIRWPTGQDGDTPIKIGVPRTKDRVVPWIAVRLTAVSPADRVKLIRYLSVYGADVEQEGWPQFCRTQAVPLVEACQRAEAPSAADGPTHAFPSPPAAMLRLFSPLIERRPFLAGVLLPLGALLSIQRLISRRTWWTVSGITAVSALVNIRLVWGRWVSPFAEFCLAVCGTMFLLGLLAPTDAGRSRNRESDVAGAGCCLAVVLIGIPLMGNAAALGWIPAQLASYCLLAGFLLLYAPALIHARKQRQHERRRRAALEADALRRWAVYEDTGRLPDAELPW
ncbi:MAG TPA: hypothetical protein VMY37_23795 [Thermoguttaceae bacterium]|nr:hypothetical protein [Thermoguttaceae bacterium]